MAAAFAPAAGPVAATANAAGAWDGLQVNPDGTTTAQADYVPPVPLSTPEQDAWDLFRDTRIANNPVYDPADYALTGNVKDLGWANMSGTGGWDNRNLYGQLFQTPDNKTYWQGKEVNWSPEDTKKYLSQGKAGYDNILQINQDRGRAYEKEGGTFNDLVTGLQNAGKFYSLVSGGLALSGMGGLGAGAGDLIGSDWSAGVPTTGGMPGITGDWNVGSDWSQGITDPGASNGSWDVPGATDPGVLDSAPSDIQAQPDSNIDGYNPPSGDPSIDNPYTPPGSVPSSLPSGKQILDGLKTAGNVASIAGLAGKLLGTPTGANVQGKYGLTNPNWTPVEHSSGIAPRSFAAAQGPASHLAAIADNYDRHVAPMGIGDMGIVGGAASDDYSRALAQLLRKRSR